MAAFQLANIREIQPEGPYLLGRALPGGHIGFEIARQLRRQGEDVAMVALFDAADVAAKQKPFRFYRQRLNHLVLTLEPKGGPSSPGRPSRVRPR